MQRFGQRPSMGEAYGMNYAPQQYNNPYQGLPDVGYVDPSAGNPYEGMRDVGYVPPQAQQPSPVEIQDRYAKIMRDRRLADNMTKSQSGTPPTQQAFSSFGGGMMKGIGGLGSMF